MAQHQGHPNITGAYDVGVVGAGHITMHYHLPVLDHFDATDISFVADIDADQARLASKVYDSRRHVIGDAAALPACDVALLATPVSDRGQYVREFASRGTAIFSEKPFAIDAETHEDYLDRTDDITCNYTRMEYGTSAQARRLVETGMLGDLEGIDVQKGILQTSTGKTEAQIDPESRGGQLHEHGSHLLSQVLFVLPEHAYDVAEADIRWNEGIDIDVEADVRAERDGEAVPVSFEFSLIREMTPEIRLRFERGTVRYDPSSPTARLRAEPADGDRAFGLEPFDDAPENHEQAIAARWAQFFAAMEAETLDPAFQTGVTVTRLIDDIYDTAGQWPRGAN